ncbi:chromate transporter [Mobilitalea sibirica]|uniref:Chromate transporter n=1 Tax=Mobilitalea sibirica TaxID=1462919 RepID=A0A8J7KRI4_9FIRM|nr:chromate transporter [Mobilitalea sibirica]MBH1939321.1 chromate transporter [Mobilitalea sibirica]
MKITGKLFWKLFISTFSLSAFTFGGGYVIVPLMKKKFVEKLMWIDEEEMLNLIAIAQSSPGAIAVNTSILIGYRIAGTFGAVVSVFGTVLPPLIILTVVSFFYSAFRDSVIVSALLKGMQAGVAAVIIDVVFKLAGNVTKGKQMLSIWMMVIAFIATFFFDVNVVIIILICALIGAITVIYREKHGKGRNQ